MWFLCQIHLLEEKFAFQVNHKSQTKIELCSNSLSRVWHLKIICLYYKNSNSEMWKVENQT